MIVEGIVTLWYYGHETCLGIELVHSARHWCLKYNAMRQKRNRLKKHLLYNAVVDSSLLTTRWTCTTVHSTVAAAEVYARGRQRPGWPRVRDHQSELMLQEPAAAVGAVAVASAAAGRKQG